MSRSRRPSPNLQVAFLFLEEMNKRKRKQAGGGKPSPQAQQQPTNAFRSAEKKFKHYKSSTQPIDLTDVIDFANIQANNSENQQLIVPIEPKYAEGDGPTQELRMYSIKGYEGFCFICNPFPIDEQLEWVERCLREYTEPPNITNLNLHYGPVSGLYEGLLQEGIVMPTTSEDPYATKKEPSTTNESANQSDNLPPKSALLAKLRWATLGYQYNWTSRTYSPQERNPFPAELAVISERFATLAQQELIAEAAIVNFYSLDTVLCGHLDDVEYDFSAPIVSISFGSSAIFLLGGKVKEDKPLAILIRSGDVMIMGGKARLCYHGVPRIIENSFPTEEALAQLTKKGENSDRLLSYLKHARVNINVRQVLKKGTDWPEQKKEKDV